MVEDRLIEAREQLSELLRLSPNSSAALMLLGDMALKEGNAAEARAHYEAARRALGGNADADTVAASASRAAGRLQLLQQKIDKAAP